MTRAAFIKLWADCVRDGRRRNYPNMRPSEEAMSRLDDEKSADKWWRKSRPQWAAMSEAEVRDVIVGPGLRPVKKESADRLPS